MKTLIMIVVVMVAIHLFAQGSYAETFKAGAAWRIITPDPLLPVSGGIGTPKPTTEKRGDLFARALVLEKGSERVAIVSIDNLGWPRVWGDKTRALTPGIPPENILIGATHTHSAPDAYCFPDPQGKHHADLDYLHWVCAQAAEAVNEAIDRLEPAHLKVTVGEAQGKIAYNYYAPQLYDPRCSILQAISAENPERVIATLVNYAIHPEVLGSNKSILSPDLCGPFYERIEASVGGVALFLNGALGGMVTADNRSDNGDLETWEECIRIGELLADEALRLIADAPIQTNPTLFVASRQISLPVESPLLMGLLRNSPLGDHMSDNNTISTRINLVNVGTAQILTMPGEALPNIGYYLKRKMNGKHAFLFGLTNDAFGYLLTKYDFNSFKRYEYISETSLGENAAEVYIEEALKLVAASPKPDMPGR